VPELDWAALADPHLLPIVARTALGDGPAIIIVGEAVGGAFSVANATNDSAIAKVAFPL